ncbi:MAG: DNA translocase FtsK [Anaerolineales bacterium]|nr:MAG: DNA translocase FtsK [Anaerolineales bacterium]
MAKKKRSTKKSSSYEPQLLPAIESFWASISPDRKLDALGILLAAVGVLTLLLVFSSSPGSFGAAWLRLLRGGLGWGLYLFPLALIVLGVWLVLRHFERIPPLRLRRLAGIGLLFGAVLLLLHAFLFPIDAAASLELAAQGMGGGRIGAGLHNWLLGGLGPAGMWVSLLTWLLIAVLLAFDLPASSLVAWLPPLFAGLRSRLPARTPQAEWEAYTPPDAIYAESGVGYASSPAVASPPLQTAPQITPEQQAEINHLAEQIDEEIAEAAAPAAEPVWELPVLADMLDPGDVISFSADHDRQRADLIEETLHSFGAPAKVVEINRGPTITQFGVEPEFLETRGGRTRVRVGKIAALADDLALALAASRIRVQAPVPGKGYVGIEVPNEQIGRVALRDVVESEAFSRLRSPLRFALGQDVAGNAVSADLAAMPHLLIAGATGSGKSVCVNALICCLLLNNTPETLRLIMIDPKRVELTGYNGIPHLLTPVVVEIDRVVGILQWVTHEMDKRYQRFAKVGARHIIDYNQRVQQDGEKLPYLVVIIDELADLMMVAPDQTEKLITRMAQLARATGIHLVLATQRPSVDVVTGLIKANFPARIAFAVASTTDSRVILDQPGAERLLGKGDMLFQPPDAPAAVRLQGAFLAESEITRITTHWRSFAGSAPQAHPGAARATTDHEGDDAPASNLPLKQIPIWEEIEEIQNQDEQDNIFDQAVDLVRRRGRASISMLQRRMRIGYTRAARIIEQMEARGIIGPQKPGAQHREVLDYGGSAAPPVGE